MIKCVLFDLDETLFDRRQTLQLFLPDQFQRFKADLGAVGEQAWVAAFLSGDNRGKRPKRELYPQLLERFDGRADIAQRLVEDYYARSAAKAVSMPGMGAVLSALKTRGIKIGIITNGETRLQTKTFNALNLPDQVDEILISEQEGCRKPDREIFERALDRLSAPAAHCLFVGDDARSDVLGAAGASLQTAWFNRDQRRWPEDLGPNPGAQITDLSEVLSMLA